MKTIKYVLLLTITIFVAALIYFNKDYFLATTALSVDIKSFAYTLPELPTIAYIGICFLFGLILSGINTISTRLCLGKTIKEKEALISKLSDQIDTLKTELDVFKHDPYIKKGIEGKSEPLRIEDQGQIEPDENKTLDTDAAMDVESAPHETRDDEIEPPVEPAEPDLEKNIESANTKADSAEDTEKTIVL